MFITFLFVLVNGIKISHFSLYNITFDNLFVKLDKKLTINAEKITILTNQKQQEQNEEFNNKKVEQIFLDIKNYKALFLFFEQINIKNLELDNNTLSIMYNKERLKINSSYFSLDLNIDLNKNEVYASINQFNFKDFVISGKLFYADTISFQGTISNKSKNIQANFDIELIKNKSVIKISKAFIKNQDELYEYLKDYISPTIKEWAFVRSRFSEAIFSAEFILINNNINSSKVVGNFVEVVESYHDKAPKAYAKNMEFSYINNKLELKAKDVIDSEKNNVKEFKLVIDEIGHSPTNIDILVENILFTKSIYPIINAYGVELNLEQLSGSANAKIAIVLDHGAKINIDVDLNGKMQFKNIVFDANNVKINIDNNYTKINGDFTYENIASKNTSIIADNHTKLVQIKSKELNINYDKYFYFNQEANFNFDLNTQILDFKELGIKIDFNNKIYFESDLNNILAYSKLFQKYKFNGGKIIFNSNYDDIKISIINSDFFMNLYEYEDFSNIAKNQVKDYILNRAKAYKNDDFYINIKAKDISLNTKSQKIKILTENNEQKLYIKDLLYNYVEDTNNDSGEDFNIFAKRFAIVYDEYLFEFQKLHLVKKLEDIYLLANVGSEDSIYLNKNKDSFNFHIFHLKADDLNKIARTKILTGGELALTASGKNFNDYSGVINIIESSIANTKFYDSLIAFFDGISSAVKLKSQRRNKDGLKVKLASADFLKQNTTIKLNNININGYKFDALGSGDIDFINNNIDIFLNIYTLKDTNSLLSQIPLVKQIVLGDSKSRLATGLKIYGKLDDIKFSNTLAQDIITAPVNLIKNIFMLPVNIFK